jgi:hypothetical protein
MTSSSTASKKPRTSVKTLQKAESKDVEQLRDEWRTMYTETLPKAAREKHPSQKHWYVWLHTRAAAKRTLAMDVYSNADAACFLYQASIFGPLLCSHYSGRCRW